MHRKATTGALDRVGLERWAPFGLLILAVAFPACKAVRAVGGAVEDVVPGGKEEEAPLAITDDALRGGLRDLFGRFTLTVQEASHAIAVETTDMSVRRQAVAWKIAAVGDLAATQLQGDPLAALIDAWTLAVQMEAFFAENGTGAEYFGSSTHFATVASAELRRAYDGFARSFMTPEQFGVAHDGIERFAADHEISGAFARASNRPSAEPAESGYALGNVLSIPLAPFRAFDGIDAGAASIHEVALMGRQFTGVMATLPQLVRWNMQLAMYDVQRLDEVQTAVASIDRFSRSTESAAATAEALPEQMRSLVTDTLTQLEASQGELQETLADAKDVMELVRATNEELGPRLEQVNAFSASLDRTAQSVTATGVAWEKTIAGINLLAGNTEPEAGDGSGAEPPSNADRSGAEPEPTDSETPSHPFDIREYGTSADALTKTAEEIRGLLEDLTGLIESPAFAARLDEVEQQTQDVLTAGGDELREAVDHAGLRLAQLAGLVFALALAYKAFAGRLGRR